MNNKGRSNKSLFEKSMKMATNVVKLSSFSIAKMSLGTAGPPPATKNRAPVTGSVTVVNNPPLHQFPGSRRSIELQSTSKPVSYLIEPIEGHGSSYVLREEKSVDGKASDYIRRVHEKNRYDSNETSTLPQYIMPPPPRVVM